MIKLAILILLILVIIFYFTYGSLSERFAPYGSILAPKIINSTAGFDFPNQFGDTTDPYQKIKDSSEAQLFYQTHDLDLR